MRRIYFDYAASTPVDRRVAAAMQSYFSVNFGNPGSLHSFGQEAIAAIDTSRETIARAIGAEFRQIIFTGGATEANNFALRGALLQFRKIHPKARPKIIVSAIEHESVLVPARDLATEGADVVELPVHKNGLIDRKKLEAEIDDRTAIVSIMYVNNEIGTIEPIAEIGSLIAAFKKQKQSTYPLFHTDAAQAFAYYPCNTKELNADVMTLSAHKLYGPKGVGALYVRDSKMFEPIVLGGGQEFGLRSGTENVPLIAGFSEAVRIAEKMRRRESERLSGLRARALAEIKKIYPSARANGPENESSLHAAHILNVHIPGEQAEELLTALDRYGIAVSAGSACAARSPEASFVIQALGYDVRRAKSSLRFSFGRQTTFREIISLGQALRFIRQRKKMR